MCSHLVFDSASNMITFDRGNRWEAKKNSHSLLTLKKKRSSFTHLKHIVCLVLVSIRSHYNITIVSSSVKLCNVDSYVSALIVFKISVLNSPFGLDINSHFLASLTAHGLLTTQAIIILQNL